MKAFKIIIVFLFIPIFEAFSQKPVKTPLWEISKKGISKKSYIIGVYHFSNPSSIDSISAINNSLKKSDIVFTEVNTSGEVEPKQPLYIEYKKFLSEEKYDSIGNWMAEIGFPSIDTLDKSKVPFIRIFANILNDFYSNKPQGEVSPLQSFDVALSQRAKSLGKEVYNLDALIMEENSYEEELYNQSQLSEMLYNIYMIRNDFKQDKINEISNNYFVNFVHNYQFDSHIDTTTFFNQNIILQRNLKWLSLIEKYLDADESLFISVGLLHLEYREGLIELLRAKGFKVKPLSIKR